MKVDQWLNRDLRLDIALLLSLLQLLNLGVIGGNVGVVVLGVVELHDLAGDGRLERAIVVCKDRISANILERYRVGYRQSEWTSVTWQVRKCSLSPDEGGPSNGCTLGSSWCRGADSGAQSALS